MILYKKYSNRLALSSSLKSFKQERSKSVYNKDRNSIDLSLSFVKQDLVGKLESHINYQKVLLEQRAGDIEGLVREIQRLASYNESLQKLQSISQSKINDIEQKNLNLIRRSQNLQSKLQNLKSKFKQFQIDCQNTDIEQKEKIIELDNQKRQMKEEIKNLTELAGPRAYINIGKIMDENKNLKFMKRDYNRLKNQNDVMHTQIELRVIFKQDKELFQLNHKCRELEQKNKILLSQSQPIENKLQRMKTNYIRRQVSGKDNLNSILPQIPQAFINELEEESISNASDVCNEQFIDQCIQTDSQFFETDYVINQEEIFIMKQYWGIQKQELEAEIKKLKKEVLQSGLKMEIRDLKMAISVYKKDIIDKSHYIKKLQERNQILEYDNSNYKRENKTLRDVFLKKSQESADKFIAELPKTYQNDAKSSIDKFQEQAFELLEQANQYGSIIKQLKQQLQKQQQQENKLRLQLGQKSQDIINKLQNKKQRLKEQQEKIQDLQQEIIQFQQANKIQETQIQDQEAIIQDKESQITILMQSTDQANCNLNFQNEKINQIQKDKDLQQKEILKLKNQLEQQQKELLRQVKQNDSASKQITGYREEILTQKQLIKDQTSQITNLKQSNQALSQKVTKYKQTIANLLQNLINERSSFENQSNTNID